MVYVLNNLAISDYMHLFLSRMYWEEKIFCHLWFLSKIVRKLHKSVTDYSKMIDTNVVDPNQ